MYMKIYIENIICFLNIIAFCGNDSISFCSTDANFITKCARYLHLSNALVTKITNRFFHVSQSKKINISK